MWQTPIAHRLRQAPAIQATAHHPHRDQEATSPMQILENSMLQAAAA